MIEPLSVQPNTTDTPPENVRTVSLDDDTKPAVAKVSLKERLHTLFKRKKSPEPTAKPGRFKLSKRGKIILAVVAGLLVVMGVYTGFVGLRLKAQASEAQTHARGALDAFKSQNLPGAESELVALQGSIDALQQTYGLLVFYKFIPLARGYYLDGEHA